MRALRVVGITEGGGELSVVLEDPARRERFVVTADEQLRAAARGDLTRLGQIAIELESQLRPREIQARIRAGASVEQVASAAGVPVQKIERFAYPVLLERSRTAEVAQRAHPVRADGPDSRMLGDVVAHTFGLRGQEYHSAEWDSWKGEDGRWVVALSWRAGRSDNRAHWTFQPGAHGGTVTAVDEHAHDLVEGLPARPLRTVGPVIDIARADEPPPQTDPHDGRELRAAASDGARGWAPEAGRVATERPPTRTAPEPRRPEPPLVRRTEPARTEPAYSEPVRTEPYHPEPARTGALQRPADGDGRLPDPRRDPDRPAASAPVVDRPAAADPTPAVDRDAATGRAPAAGLDDLHDAPDVHDIADLGRPVAPTTAEPTTAEPTTAEPTTPGETAAQDSAPVRPAASAAETDTAADRAEGSAAASTTGPVTSTPAASAMPATPVASGRSSEPAASDGPSTGTPAPAQDPAVPAEPDQATTAATPARAGTTATSSPDETLDAATPEEPRKPAAPARRTKKGKPVMPSWDEVLLGVRGQR
jgi:Protein of unknown function (DUF3071)